VIAVLAGAGVLTSAASASIVVGQSIDGVKLGETQAQVRAQLGKPSYTDPPDSKGNSDWGYTKGLLGRVGFDSTLRVDAVWTASSKQQTSKGIHTARESGKKTIPGSSLSQVRKAYPNAKCVKGDTIGFKWKFFCELKSRYLGRVVVTSFAFATTLSEVQINYA
jgi:hypothetical protein